MDIETSLKTAMAINGAVGATLVDHESGMVLGTAGGGELLDLELASAGNTEVVRAELRTVQSLDIGDDIEDILITLGTQHHLIRLLRTEHSASLFLYLALDRATANPALARHELRAIEAALEI